MVLKGICHPEDARRAVDEGIDGIYVSTHGGRQANGGLAAIDCLPEVARRGARRPGALRLRRPVRLRRGEGARAGCHGRRHRSSLRLRAALGGTDGIVHVLRTMLAEADLLMAVDGYPTLADLGPDAMRRT